jgi:protein disulfide-isomerase A1
MSTFTDLASRNHHKFAFGIASNANLAKAGSIPVPSLVCYKAWEGEQEILSGQSGIEALEKFMETATTHPIGEMTRRNEMRYLKVRPLSPTEKGGRTDIHILQAGKSLIYIFTLTESERSTYRASLKPLAKKYQEYLNFVTIDAVEYAYMAPMLGLEAGVFPALAVQNPMLGQVFPYDQHRITAEAVESFILDIVQSRVQPGTGGAERQGSAHDEL